MYSYEHTESLSTKMALFHRFYMLTVYKVRLFWPGAARGPGRLSCPARGALGGGSLPSSWQIKLT